MVHGGICKYGKLVQFFFPSFDFISSIEEELFYFAANPPVDLPVNYIQTQLRSNFKMMFKPYFKLNYKRFLLVSRSIVSSAH